MGGTAQHAMTSLERGRSGLACEKHNPISPHSLLPDALKAASGFNNPMS
jgi:hypothetical protein